MSVNGIILDRLKSLEKELTYLRSERDQVGSFDEFRNDIRLFRAVEHSLQIAIQMCLDIGQRLCSQELARHPETYRNVFEILVDENVIPQQLMIPLRNMVGFRNIIVHEYERVDAGHVYGILKTRLGDFETFANAISHYMERTDS